MIRMLNLLRVSAILFAFAACLHGQDVPQNVDTVVQPAKPKVEGSVRGHILFADVHAPARGARVMLLPLSSLEPERRRAEAMTEQPRLGVTALDGSFLISGVGPGEYLVVAMAAGYLSPLDGMTVSVNTGKEEGAALLQQLRRVGTIVRIEGSGAVQADIELQRGAIVSGKVMYADGSPAGQLPVFAQKTTEQEDAQPPKDRVDMGLILNAILLKQSLNTDDQGHFRLAGIAPGSYRLAVTQSFENTSMNEAWQGSINPGAMRQNGKLTVYSGSTLHRKDAKTFDLKVGDRIDDIEIVLPLTGLHTVRGIAAGNDGSPLNYCSLDLTDTTDTTIVFHTRIRENGEFQFSGVPEGSYELKAAGGRIFQMAPSDMMMETDLKYLAMTFKPLRAFADTTVSVAVQHADLEGLTLTLADMKIPESELKSSVSSKDDPDQ